MITWIGGLGQDMEHLTQNVVQVLVVIDGTQRMMATIMLESTLVSNGAQDRR